MPPKRERLAYDLESRRSAAKDYKNGMCVRAASEKHGVPKSTIQDHKNDGATQGPSKMGPRFTLHADEEQQLVEWAKDLAKRDLQIKLDDLLNSVQRIMENVPRANRFKNNRPGLSWEKEFHKRHPGVIAKNAKLVAGDSQGNVERWFNGLGIHLKTVDSTDILQDPRRVFMALENNFKVNGETGGKIVPKGWKNAYQPGSKGNTITVLFTFSALGDSVLPFVVLPQSSTIEMPSVPSDWLNARSDSGLMKSETFHTFMKEGFSEWVKSNDVRKPVILLVHGQTTHLTLELSQFCDEHEIILYGLPPSSKTVPPALFCKPLKNGSTREMFFPRIEAIIRNDNLSDKIENEFSKLGLNSLRLSGEHVSVHTAGEEERMQYEQPENEENFEAFVPMVHEIIEPSGHDPLSHFDGMDMSAIFNKEVEPLNNILDISMGDEEISQPIQRCFFATLC